MQKGNSAGNDISWGWRHLSWGTDMLAGTVSDKEQMFTLEGTLHRPKRWDARSSNIWMCERSPKAVKAPVLSRAVSTHNWYRVLWILSFGGGSMKSKSSRFSTFRDFSNRTVLPRFVLWISGIVVSSISFLKAVSVYNLLQCDACCHSLLSPVAKHDKIEWSTCFAFKEKQAGLLKITILYKMMQASGYTMPEIKRPCLFCNATWNIWTFKSLFQPSASREYYCKDITDSLCVQKDNKGHEVDLYQVVPGPVLPALPLRWLDAAWLHGKTCRASIPILGL